MKKVDFLAPKLNLNLNGETSIKTNLGIVLSCFIIVISIVLFIGFGLDMIEKKKPNSYTSKKNNNFPLIKFKDMFQMVSISGPLLADVKNLTTKFSFKMFISYVDLAREANKTEVYLIDMVPCLQSEKYKQNHYNASKYLATVEENYYCFPDWFDKDLYGQDSSQNYTYFQFALFRCDNATTNNTCVSEEAIMAEFPYYFLNLISLDYYIEIEDYENPIKPFINSQSFVGSLNAFTQNKIYKKIVSFTSDNGWIIDSPEERTIFQTSSIENNKSPLSDLNYNHIIDLTLINLQDTYYRSYIKVQDVLAKMGGLIKILTLFANLINNYFVKFNMIEEFFKIKLNQSNYMNNSELKNIKEKENPNTGNIINLSAFEHSGVGRKIITKSNKSLFKLPNKKENLNENDKVNANNFTEFDFLSFCQKFLYFKCVRTKKVDNRWALYNVLYEEIKMSTDIMNLFNLVICLSSINDAKD